MVRLLELGRDGRGMRRRMGTTGRAPIRRAKRVSPGRTADIPGWTAGGRRLRKSVRRRSPIGLVGGLDHPPREMNRNPGAERTQALGFFPEGTTPPDRFTGSAG